MNAIQILLHIGAVVRMIEDGEKTIADLTHKAPAGTDAMKTLDDAVALVIAGLIPLPPGLTSAAVQEAIADLKSVLQKPATA